jgi:hypothetical protein
VRPSVSSLEANDKKEDVVEEDRVKVAFPRTGEEETVSQSSAGGVGRDATKVDSPGPTRRPGVKTSL